MFKIWKKKHQNDKKCLKCQYEDLYTEGKKIFKSWNQKGSPPKTLLKIQKELLNLKKQIDKTKINNKLHFCSSHPEIYEYLPIEWI